MPIRAYAAGLLHFKRSVQDQEIKEDIGNAVAKFSGAANQQLTSLLTQHFSIAVDLIKAAKAGDKAARQHADTKWQQNSVEIAGFLSKANPTGQKPRWSI